MPLEPDPPGLVRSYIENREANFLDLMRRAVFAYPTNPYYRLFQWAGCTYGDWGHPDNRWVQVMRRGAAGPTCNTVDPDQSRMRVCACN